MAARTKKATPKAKPKAGGRHAYGYAANKHTTEAIRLSGIEKDFTRADLQFEGLEHGGATYEARVFLNNPKADATTPRTLEQGYAGRFHIFGHGGCYGDDEGHCEVRPRRAYDPRPEHALTPATKTVIATKALQHALKKGKDVTVTVVPIVVSGTKKCDYNNVLGFQHIKVLTYR